jgi:hypothetical protein
VQSDIPAFALASLLSFNLLVGVEESYGYVGSFRFRFRAEGVVGERRRPVEWTNSIFIRDIVCGCALHTWDG